MPHVETDMFALVFAAALAQPAIAPSPSATATVSAPSPVGVPRRIPAAALEPASKPGDAVIHNSGSTNVAGYTIVVHPDASADFAINGAAGHGLVEADDAKALFAALEQVKPLDAMPSEHCMKSASFGSTTTITLDGRTSPDLSCGGGDQARALRSLIAKIAGDLGIKPGAGARRLHLLQTP